MGILEYVLEIIDEGFKVLEWWDEGRRGLKGIKKKNQSYR